MTKFTRRAARRPAEIVEAALGQFYAAGFAGTKVEDIAREAGITAGTIYRYFPSKEMLFQAIIEAHLDAAWTRGREIAEAYGTLTAREVIELLLTKWQAVLALPGPGRVAVLVIREAPVFPDAVALYEKQLLAKARLAIERALRHGIDRGEFPLLPIESTARALIGAPIEALLWRETFGGGDETAARDAELVDLLVRGIPRLGPDADPALPSPVGRLPQVDATPPTTHAPGTIRITTLQRPTRD